MTKPIAIIGTPGSVPASYRKDTAAAFAVVGHNTGNLAFQHAVWANLDDDKICMPFEFKPEEVREQARLVCVPAANFLYSGFDLGGLADRLEATGLPLMVLGLGAQAMRDISEVKLQPGTLRLLKLFAERCATIVVRGRHTGEVLEKHGVTNFEVLGCPSNFINPHPKLGAGILARWKGQPRKLIGYAPTFYSYNAAFEGALHAAIGPQLAEIVAQDPVNAVALARGDRTEATSAWLESKAGYLSALSAEERQRALSLLRAYFSAEAWMESYRRLDAVLGTRIHGVNLAWQAGRAAMIISYDLRTAELAETMGIPLAQARELDASRPMPVMEEAVERCAATYDERRRGLAARFVAALEAHGTTPSAALRSLAGNAAAQPAASAPTPVVVPPGPAASAPPPQKAAALSAAPAVKAAPLPKPKVWGFLEQYNRQRVAGWVASDAPEPPQVMVKLDGRDIGIADIARPRTDVGKHAWTFSLPVPAEALVRDVMRVEAVVASTGAPLQNSPVVTSFAEGDSRKVLQGREGYLFLQNDTNAVLDQVRGRRKLTAAELDAWASFFLELDSAAATRGASAVYLVAPNKECVFASHLPAEVQLSEERPVRQLEALVKSLGLRATRLVYPLEALAKPGPHPTYPRGDSHWSDYGAMLALSQVEPIALPGPEEYKTEYRNADLLSKLGGVCVEPMPVLKRGFSTKLVGDNKVVNTGRRRDFRSGLEAAKGRLLMSHDSFGEWLIQPLAERYAETTAIWSPALERAVLEQVNPTTILFERAERFLTSPARMS